MQMLSPEHHCLPARHGSLSNQQAHNTQSLNEILIMTRGYVQMTTRKTDRLTHTAQLIINFHYHNFHTAGLGLVLLLLLKQSIFHMIVIAIAHLSVTAGCSRPLPSLLPPVLAERVPGFLLLPLLLSGRSLAG